MRSKISLAVGRSDDVGRMHSLMSAAMLVGHCSGTCTKLLLNIINNYYFYFYFFLGAPSFLSALE